MPAADASLTPHHVAEARERLGSWVLRTPAVTSVTLDERLGLQVVAKAENLQRTGSFKLRGALNALLAQEPAAAGGVITASAGNHGQAVAYAARLLGLPATILMPADAVAFKADRVAGFGGRLDRFDRHAVDRELLLQERARHHRALIVHPFDDPFVAAGQGTAALELLEQDPELDVLLVPVGGGGLLTGCALALEHADATTRLFGVEPAAADDWARSVESGVITRIAPPTTIADGQRVQQPGKLVFETTMAGGRLDGMLRVSEDAIRTAMRLAAEELHLFLEPSGACALAALTGPEPAFPAGTRVGVLLSGGNVDARTWAQLALA